MSWRYILKTTISPRICNQYQYFITACVRSTRESTVFTGVYLLTSTGGTPFPGPGGGYPLPREGVLPSQVGGGTTFPGGGYPLPRQGGYYLPRWGVPPSQPGGGGVLPSQVGGGVLPSQAWGQYPIPEQHSVYLLRDGRYACYVHAGGLSCLFIYFCLYHSPTTFSSWRFCCTVFSRKYCPKHCSLG